MKDEEIEEEIEKKEINCPKCKYIWKSKSKFYYVTCPNCYYKVKIVNLFPLERTKISIPASNKVEVKPYFQNHITMSV